MYIHSLSLYELAQEAKKANRLKMLEIKRQMELEDRKEQLEKIRRMNDEVLVSIFKSTEQYEEFDVCLKGGLNNVTLLKLGTEKKENPYYCMIHSEMYVRGLI